MQHRLLIDVFQKIAIALNWSVTEPGRNISYATQTPEGTQAIDTFMSLVATTRQLGISFFEYIRDRISQVGNIPSLATIIREKSAFNES